MIRIARILSVAGALCVASAASAIINGVEPDPGDTRFDAVAAFGRTVRLNGTVEEHNHFGNGTLITPTKMIMARHLVNFGPDDQPASGEYTFRFRRNPDGSLGTKAAGWESFHQVEVTHFTFHGEGSTYPDVLIAHLAEPVTHIEPIAVAHPGFLRAGMNVITAAWGTEADGSRGRLTMHTNVQEVQDPDSPTGMTPCSWVNLDEANGNTAPFDSGGAFLVMSTRIPYPYDYIDRDPQDGVIGSDVRGGGATPAGPFTPVPVEPRPVLVGVINFAGNAGSPAFWHEVFEPCVDYDCTRTDRIEGPCVLLFDLDGDYIVTEDDYDLALPLYVGPCDGTYPDLNLCTRIDYADGPWGNGDGFVDASEFTAFFYDTMLGLYCHCLEDVSGDGVVDASDVMQVMAAFGPCDCDEECLEDVNQDRVVDQADIDQILMHLGQCDH